MAVVKPFRGVRPPKHLVEKVESRPYDVLDSDEARAEAGDNEMSLYHIIKPEINFPEGTSEYDHRVYDSAVEHFQKFQSEGWLEQDEKELYYIYAQTMNGKTQSILSFLIALVVQSVQLFLHSKFNSQSHLTRVTC